MANPGQIAGWKIFGDMQIHQLGHLGSIVSYIRTVQSTWCIYVWKIWPCNMYSRIVMKYGMVVAGSKPKVPFWGMTAILL